MYDTIVVGVDGSDTGEHAFAVAGQMAANNQSRLVVVHVTEIIGGKGGTYPLYVDEDEFRTHLKSEVSALQARDVAAELFTEMVQIGGPARVIAEVATSVNADLIVIGRSGHTAVAGLLLGSVAIKLLHIAPCPILVVPPSG